MYDLDRREFTTLCLSTLAVSAAGCGSPRAGTTTPHAEWLPASDGGTIAAYIDFGLSEETTQINPVLPLVVPPEDAGDDGDALAPTLSNVDELDDPLLTFPLQAGGRVLGGAVLSMSVIGLGDLVDPRRPTEGVRELFFADGVAVGLGDVEPDDVEASLRTGPALRRLEPVGESGEYALYGTPSEDGGFAAVSETAVVVADSRRDVETVLDTRRGDGETAVAADDTFASLLDATDTGHVQVGWKAPIDLGQFTIGSADAALSPDFISTDDDVVASVTFEPDDGEILADLALSGADGVRADSLDARLGSASADRSLSVDGDRVVASATYTEETVDLDFVADETATETSTVPGQEALPDSVARAVPEDAFAFAFVEEDALVRVEFLAEVDAEKVTLRAVESGYESSTTTPASVRYLNVFVDPEGDAVTVTVTVDGVSGVVARYDVP